MIHRDIPLPVQYRKFGIENNGFTPSLSTYILDNPDEINPERKRPFVLVCPGGGYAFRSAREGEPIAIKMNGYGFDAAVLSYSVAPMDFPAAFLDLCEAVRAVRANAAEWGVDPERVFVLGCSAGGHLAASLAVWWNTDVARRYLPYRARDIRPSGICLCYPVITSGAFRHEGSMANLLGKKNDTPETRNEVSIENLVNEDVPPVFIWHTETDEAVPVENSLLFAQALRAKRIPYELHVFARGPHGLSLATEETAREASQIAPECAVWPDLFAAWVNAMG